MKKSLFLLPTLLLMFSSCSDDEPAQVFDNNDNKEISGVGDDWELSNSLKLTSEEKALMSNFDRFNYDLIGRFAEMSPDGFSVSPVSISIYLGMVANATDGQTRDEILDLLNTSDLNALNALNQKLMHYLPADGNGALLEINNRLWVADKFTAPEPTIDALGTNFNAGVEYVDFGKSTTVPYINGWISDRTHGLIKSILDGDWTLYADTKTVIANTVYFKGEWALKFDAAATDKAKFHTSDGDITVDMMHNVLETKYYGDEKMQMVTLAYEGGLNTLELYLPAKGISVNEMIAGLDGAAYKEILRDSRVFDVTLSLPKFNSGCNTDLNGILYALGLETLKSADMSPLGINGLQPLQTIHKTVIKVDEEGTELAAVTGGFVTSSGADENKSEKVEVTYDRPFFFVVRNRIADAVLMAGVVTKP